MKRRNPTSQTLEPTPHGWEEVLDALNTVGEEEAGRLIRKYNFDDEDGKRKRGRKGKQRKFNYFSQSPEGEITPHKAPRDVAKHLDVEVHVIYRRLEYNHTEWLRGELTGWSVWREEKE